MKKKRYEYKVLWAGCPASEASFVAEDQNELKKKIPQIVKRFNG